jgi:crotonobetaine/carnitine-CoA ligase
MATLRYAFPHEAQTTLPQILERRAELTPERRFVTLGEESLTFADFAGRAAKAAAALADSGVRRGDRVAVMMSNSVTFLELWFGTALLGGVLVPINTGLRGDSLSYVVEHSAPTVLACGAELATACDDALPGGALPTPRFAFGGVGGSWQPGEGWLAGAYALPQRPRLDPGDPASILYTSGTTGRPKGAINPQNVFGLTGSEYCREHVVVGADDVLYTCLPLFHVNAMMLSTMGSLVSGLPLIMDTRFTASGFFDQLRRHGVTVFNYVGAMLTMIFKQPERESDSVNPARIAVGGAAPAELWPQFERRFGVSIREIYGLTETGCYCVGSPPDDPRVGKIGRPVSWSEIRIEDEDGGQAPIGEPGEIAIRSRRPDVLFKGYYKDPEATAEAMRGGWFHSGDRGRLDPDGYFVFLDRIKDVIRRRGENISSFEVERVLNDHGAVAESAVVGVPSELGEEDVMAVIALTPGSRVAPEELIAHCEGRMAPFMVPRYVRFVEALPKTATARVQKYLLREEPVGPGDWDREAT